jgi:hypothetical protein
MIDLEAVKLALRNRARALLVATTGAASLSATSTGFARLAGSFAADGFAEGEEFVAAGFGVAGNNGPRVISNVQPLLVTTTTAPVTEAAAGGRSLVVGLPQTRSWENKAVPRLAGRPYVDENFVPATHALTAGPAQGGFITETGLYVITWFGLENADTGGINKPMNALKALFAPGTVLLASDGTRVRIRGDVAPQSGQIIPQLNGWAANQLRIPWLAQSLNVIAA